MQVALEAMPPLRLLVGVGGGMRLALASLLAGSPICTTNTMISSMTQSASKSHGICGHLKLVRT